MSEKGASAKKAGLTKNLVFAIASGAIGSAFQHGYNSGVVNAPQQLVNDFISRVYTSRNGSPPSKDQIDLIYSVITGIFCLGGMIGALSTAFFANRFGRKGSLIYNNGLVFVAAAFMGLCQKCDSYEMLIVGRFIIGLNAGLNAGLAPMYLSEISPVSMRGAVGTIYQLVIVISILLSNILGLPGLFGTAAGWPWLFAAVFVPAILMLATFPFCPESPKYILFIQEKEVAAQAALTWLRGTIEVHDEMDEMKLEKEKMKSEPKVLLGDMWSNQVLRQPLIIAVMLMFCQQFSGINAVIYFSTKIFQTAGLDPDQALNATMGMSVLNVLMTLVSMALIEKAGRKSLMVTGLGGMAVVTVLLTVSLTLKNSVEPLRYVAIVCLFAFMVFFAVGPGSIPWLMVGELFQTSALGLASSIAVATNWSSNLVVGLFFLPLNNLMDDYVFLLFTGLLTVFTLYVVKKVPETKGKTVEEVTAHFRSNVYGN